jgi:phosphomannomutase
MITDYVSAYCKIIPDGSIVVGRDGRPSGKLIEALVSSTIIACGRKPKIIGIAPTPTVQLMVEHSDSVGGIAITASHNPIQWNGLKFTDSEGVFLDAEQNAKLWDCVDSASFEYSGDAIPVDEEIIEDAIDRHINSIFSLPFLAGTDLAEKIKNKKYKVVVDAVNCSGSIAIPKLLKMFGCEVIELYCDSSGKFPHIPEPLPENLTSLAESVRIEKADLGIAVDPDADRLVLIDENGNPIGEEKTIAVAVDSAFSFKKYFDESFNDIAVVNYSTTRLVEDITAKHNAIVERSPVGEINVVNKMKSTNAFIGGEGSGGVILPACHYGRDSLVGVTLLLSILASKDISLSKLIDTYPTYSMQKYKEDFSGSLEALKNKIVRIFPYGKATIDDGIKIELDNSWVQLRSSNTEPIIRIIAEAPDEKSAKNLITAIKHML